MKTTTQPYTPTADAGAELLQLAFENLLLGHSSKEDTEEALRVAFLGVNRYGINQDNEGGEFCRGSVSINRVLGSITNADKPVILVEHQEFGPQVLRPNLGFNDQPLFSIYPLAALAIVTTD